MAVQAQYPSNPFRARNGVLEDQSANLLRAYTNYAVHPQILNGTVFSDPESELTCNVSGSRKRSRPDTMSLTQQQFRLTNFQKIPEKTEAVISTGFKEENCLMESAAASTSGRNALSQDVVSCLQNQSIELDAFIRLQNEKLRSGLEEAQKRHFRSLLLAIEYRVLKRLKEKETELDSVRRKNADLEEKVKQMSAENQIWCHVARNNEAIVSNLRTNLEQILSQNSVAAKEGYGDSSDDGIAVVADEAHSCCYEAIEETTDAEKTIRENREMMFRKTCKACQSNEVSVLLLPCRHLCLCKECESRIDFCPICKSMKNASLQIFMS